MSINPKVTSESVLNIVYQQEPQKAKELIKKLTYINAKDHEDFKTSTVAQVILNDTAKITRVGSKLEQLKSDNKQLRATKITGFWIFNGIANLFKDMKIKSNLKEIENCQRQINSLKEEIAQYLPGVPEELIPAEPRKYEGVKYDDITLADWESFEVGKKDFKSYNEKAAWLKQEANNVSAGHEDRAEFINKIKELKSSDPDGFEEALTFLNRTDKDIVAQLRADMNE